MVHQAELAERAQETSAPLGMDVELLGQRIGCGCTTAEGIEQAEINGSKEGLGVDVREGYVSEATGRLHRSNLSSCRGGIWFLWHGAPPVKGDDRSNRPLFACGTAETSL
jgi:hypothetical protein